MTSYSFERGETIRLALDCVQGDPAIVSAITARMRRKVGGVEAADFTVTPRAAAGGIAAGWDLTIAPADSAALPAAVYVADARLVVAGGVEITNAVEVNLRPSPSGEAG